MIARLENWLHLTGDQIFWLMLISLAAGIVRGFSGFALSAMVLACAALILPPVELIPICWWLEMSASAMMMSGGWKEGNRKVAVALAVSSGAGMPLGLALTASIQESTSKLTALILLIVLALTQIARLRLPFLATNTGLYGTGIVAGIATGVAGIGGMVVALYVLARQAPVKEMRGSLVLFLFLGSVTSAVTLFLFGVMDGDAVRRGIVFAVPATFGVYLGKLLFLPQWSKFYKPACLILLLCLAVSGVIRLLLGA